MRPNPQCMGAKGLIMVNGQIENNNMFEISEACGKSRPDRQIKTIFLHLD